MWYNEAMITNDLDARAAIVVLDEKVAAIFGKRPRCPTIRFVPLIERHETRYGDGRVRVDSETLGTCDSKNNIITLCIRDGWQATAIHEEVHLYNPGRRESWVKDMARKVGVYLKGEGPHPLATGKAGRLQTEWEQGVKDWSHAVQ